MSYLTPDHRYKWVNQSYSSVFAFSPGDIVGRHIPEITGDFYYCGVRAYLERALAGERVTFESRIPHKDGTFHDLKVTYSPHIDRNGQVQGVAVFVQDITTEKQTRLAIRQREQDLLSVLNNVPDVISRYRPDLRFQFTSAAVERLTGIPPAAFIGKTLSELGFSEELAEKLDSRLLQVFATGKGDSVRFEAPGPQGLRHYEAVAAPEFGEDGSVVSVLTIAHDITDRLHAEESRQLAVEAGKVGLWQWDLLSNAVEWSDYVYQLHDVEPGTFDGTVESYREMIHPDDRQRVGDALTEALNGSGEYHVELRTYTRAGELRWLFTNGQAIFHEGRPVRMLGAAIDITESKMAAENLRRANDELRRANEDLNQFAYAASHDLKEPLRMVSIYTQLLKRNYIEQLDDKALQYIHFAVDGARRMELLISDLLAYTQVTAAQDEDPVTRIDVQSAISAALQNLEAAIQESGARVTQDAFPPVRWRHMHAVQVFQNLIGNAIKYRRDGCVPEIHLSSEREGDRDGAFWRFGVHDNGIGVDPCYHDKIFGIFRRLHTSDKYEGTGIGLAICQRIVERNGGRIWIESEPDHGCTFYFTCSAA